MIPQFPLWALGKSDVLTGTATNEGSVLIPTWSRVVGRGEGHLVMVATQCCDLENPRQRTGVLIAPVMRIPANPREEKYQDVLASATPSDDGQFRWLNLFPLEMPDSSEPVVADISALTTMATSQQALEVLEAGKVAEMNEDTRAALRFKLAFMMGRDPDRQVERGEKPSD